MNRRDFLKNCAAVGVGGFVLSNQVVEARVRAKSPNILLITADDMNYDSPGVYGCGISDITPNIDRLAAEGLRFTHSHITIAVCQPSRSVLMTGRYPHRNGAEGFEPIDTAVPTLAEQLHSAGYINGIMAKNSHLTPRAKFCWDYYIEAKELGKGRDPSLYYKYARKFFEDATAASKPFFLMANSQDPHRPFAGSQQEQKKWGAHLPYSRKITTEEAEVPGFLPELNDVHQEVSEYFTSVHRCDQTVGQVLRALKDTGFEDNTLVMFLSDNGIALLFAKTNCYLNSTRTPWIVRWPGVVKPGTVDTEHFISGIDYMPTILDVVGLPCVAGTDGTSFVPLLKDATQKNRDKVFTVFHETSAKRRYEMRCVQNKKFGYIYNAWSDGRTVFKNESQSGLTMNAMKRAAKTNPDIAARIQLFLYRVPEELYDFKNDPDALHNLANAPMYQQQLAGMRQELLAWMERTEDPLSSGYREFLSGSGSA
ncbi:MAG: sulfatase family protein [Planctomycetota bacterium]